MLEKKTTITIINNFKLLKKKQDIQFYKGNLNCFPLLSLSSFLPFSLYSLIYILSIVFLLTSCTSDPRGERQDQGRTDACWIYAMTECVEREMWSTGDSIPLSRQWLVAKCLEEQTLDRRLSHGARTISLRGVGPEAIRLINTYGLIPFSQEKSRALNSRTLERRLTLLADQSDRTDGPIPTLLDSARDLLPHFTVARHEEEIPSATHPPFKGGLEGPQGLQSPPTFYLFSVQYTPQSFAESIMYRQHWQFYASSPYHPYGKPFALEVADNRRYHEYINLPMTELLNRTLRSLRDGHPVYWELGRKPSKQPGGGGAASDHAMAIIGLKKATDGKLYLICQNSYGKKWGEQGKVRVSLPYFLLHTSNVGILHYKP